eukprot:3577557-Rhodomonas_salina.1
MIFNHGGDEYLFPARIEGAMRAWCDSDARTVESAEVCWEGEHCRLAVRFVPMGDLIAGVGDDGERVTRVVVGGDSEDDSRGVSLTFCGPESTMIGG